MRRPAPQRDMPPPLELECLKALWGIGEGTVRDVRHVMVGNRNLAYTTVMTVLDRLEKRGLLTRLRCSKDRRIVRLAVTPEGSAIAEQMPAIFAGVREQLLSGFTPEEVGFLKSMLRRALINGGG